MAETVAFEQLLYSWSESNLFGRRGFGVVAASRGWLPLLAGRDDVLGPVVAYPQPGRGGAHPPVHGGYTVLRGTPVLFRRVPNGTDALDRPGNYTVQVLFGADAPADADLAAGLLASDWPTSPLPPAGPDLPVLRLPKPGPRRGSSAADPVVCGALLQGRRDGAHVVLAADAEPKARLALCDAVRRLPVGLGSLSFSTLEAEPGRSPFDVAVAVAGWESGPGGPGVLRVAGPEDLDADCERWGRALASATAASLKGLTEPVAVEALGMRLDALAVLREDPRRLTADQLLSVLTSPEGQTWAATPEAVAVARSVVSGMDPALGPQFARAAARRPAVSALLRTTGWDLVSSATPSRQAAQTLLLGLGEQSADIDMALLSSGDGRLSRADAQRLLSLIAAKGGGLDPAMAARIAWDGELAAAHAALWFEAVVLGGQYHGPRASREVLAALAPADVARVLDRAPRTDTVVVQRLWAVAPTARQDVTRYLRLIAAGGPVGLGLVFEQLLAQPSLDPRVRTQLLEQFWPILVRELRLPGYLGDALVPAGARQGPPWPAIAAVLALIAAAAVAAALLL